MRTSITGAAETAASAPGDGAGGPFVRGRAAGAVGGADGEDVRGGVDGLQGGRGGAVGGEQLARQRREVARGALVEGEHGAVEHAEDEVAEGR
ncbi:hypothetical protein [Actinomadura madurae]|uniref:hypothetical protein n=1 Tax=Actinomadura madurae TaxID=1993 RepID=UPI0020D25611|nr:hypothetical protein [Actinomadura madurae]MCP9953347.1 hypothetical protein [Actinomadura madurae]MCP9982570.1 hypothetical protein [Actinomadura madurae]